MKLDDFLVREYSYDPKVKNNLQIYIDQWHSWYAGNVKSFHNYFIYNGKKKVPQKRYTLNMAKEISEEWANILWSEKCSISLKSDKSNDDFEELVNETNLYVVINQLLEKAGALGTCASVVRVYDIAENKDSMVLNVDNSKMAIDIVDIDQIYPLSWNNKEVTECAFSAIKYIKGKKYVILTVHLLGNSGNYEIHNHLFLETNGALTELKDLKNTMNVFDTQSEKKWFAIFKPLLTNNLFKNSPFGIPYYANAIDNLKAVDMVFDALKNEVNDGKRRTFVRADMFSYDDGQQRLVFDPNDTTVYQLPDGANKDDLIQSDSNDLRTDKLIPTLNLELNLLGNKVGFGRNYYHFDGNTLTTATAVISSNSKMFRNKKKLEVGYESSIYDLVDGLCYAATKFGKYSIDTDKMAIQFDDSIIEDKETEANRAMREQSAGIISKVEYRVKIFGETEDVAKKAIEEIKKLEPSMDDLLGTKTDNADFKKVEKKEEKKETKKDEEAKK